MQTVSDLTQPEKPNTLLDTFEQKHKYLHTDESSSLAKWFAKPNQIDFIYAQEKL